MDKTLAFGDIALFHFRHEGGGKIGKLVPRHGLSIEPQLDEVTEIPGGINWVITGAESGRKKVIRPYNEDWARSLRDQCWAAAIPFFYKQCIEGGRKIETPELDGRRHTEFPLSAGSLPNA